MAQSKSKPDFSHLRDIMGTLPMIKSYIPLCLLFSLDTDTSIVCYENVLREALLLLSTAFPFLTGQVVLEGSSEGNIGIPKITPLRDTIELIVKDLRQNDRFPSMSEIKSSGYPFSTLDPNILAPSIANSWTADRTGIVAPVFLLQANFVKGGLLLTISGNHMTMDMTGMGMIISFLSKACRNETFTEEELQQGNQSRRNVVPLLGDGYEPGPEVADILVKPSNREKITFASPPRWAYFNFKANSLYRLKIQASKTQTLVPYISTDDALGALCWQQISKARQIRLADNDNNNDTVKSQFLRPVSMRKYLGLQGYTGHMVDTLYERETNVHEKPLGEIAGRLRAMLLKEEKIVHHVRAFATLLDRLEDKSKLANGAPMDASRDVCLSSWTNVKCCEWEFGSLLGLPDAARSPNMPAWPSLCYLMPKSREGDIAVGFCLEEDVIKQLREDQAFAQYADYVG